MNLYLITCTASGEWETYEAAVVAAPDQDTAKEIHPSGDKDQWGTGTWAKSSESVRADPIGVASEGTECGVILASYHAG